MCVAVVKGLILFSVLGYFSFKLPFPGGTLNWQILSVDLGTMRIQLSGMIGSFIEKFTDWE